MARTRPVTRLLDAHGERIHPLSSRLASESRHFELEAAEHDLNAFQAIRRMDEVLIANFMIFQDAVDEADYALVIADEAWDIDHYWHEHPELKKAKLAWLTDFVIGEHPMTFGSRTELRHRLGYRTDERVCIVTVGGSGVGTHLIKRILESYPMVRARLPELRMILVTGPRIDPALIEAPGGVEMRNFVPDLDRPSGGVRSRFRAGWTHNVHGIDSGQNTVSAQKPLRAEFPCRPPSRPLWRRTADGLCDAGSDRGGDGCGASGADTIQAGRG